MPLRKRDFTTPPIFERDNPRVETREPTLPQFLYSVVARLAVPTWILHFAQPMAAPRPSLVSLDGKGQRRQGQTRNQYKGASLHGNRLKQAQKAKSPSPEDINAPPKDTSDDESGNEENNGEEVAHLGENHERKEPPRNPSSDRAPEPMGRDARTHRSANPVAGTNMSTSSSQQSNPKRSSDELDDMSGTWSQARSKKARTGANCTQLKYGSSQHTTANIHLPLPEKLGKSSEKAHIKDSNYNQKRGSKGFKIPPANRPKKRGISAIEVTRQGRSPIIGSETETESQAKGPKFKAVPDSKNWTRSPTGSECPANSSIPPTFNAPKCLPLQENRPTTSDIVPSFKTFGPSSRSAHSSRFPREASKHANSSRLPSYDQYDHAMYIAADKLGMDDNKENTNMAPSSSMSATTHSSSSSSSSIGDCSQSSGLSTPPDSPTKTRCPLCKGLVEKEWFEEVTGCKRLTMRQQSEFCKSHKIKSAHDDWRQRGYPNIDWTTFNQRMMSYHSAIENTLQGHKPSFYRNALEDSIRAGKNRTLKQTMMQGHDLEGLCLGYYGSRGAKMMVDNIIVRFASKLRRLGNSDKLISTSGVSGYVQAVLAPELAVLLVMDDMNTDEDGAREVLKESVDIGNLLNEEEDEVTQRERCVGDGNGLLVDELA